MLDPGVSSSAWLPIIIIPRLKCRSEPTAGEEDGLNVWVCRLESGNVPRTCLHEDRCLDLRTPTNESLRNQR